MDTGKLALIILASASWVFTVGTSVYAIVRLVDLRRHWRGHEDFADMHDYAVDQVVHETGRLLVCTIVCSLIFMTPGEPPPLMERRNVGIAAAGVLMGLKSAYSLIRRRVRMRRYYARNP